MAEEPELGELLRDWDAAECGDHEVDECEELPDPEEVVGEADPEGEGW